MTQFKSADTGRKILYWLGALAALLAVFVFRRNLSAELTVFQGFGIFAVPDVIPVRALEWFRLLQENRFVGLALLDFFDLVEFLLVGLIFLALYFALKPVSRRAALIGITCGLAGVLLSCVLNPALPMLALSEQYAAATTEAQQSTILVVGDSLLKNQPGIINQRMGIGIGLFLVLLAGLIFSIAMLRSDVFGKATAVTGILANGIYLVYFCALAVAPLMIWLPPTLSAPFRMIWYILIAVKLFPLSKSV
jgi:hypothetical protein